MLGLDFFNAQDIPYHGWYCYVISRHFEIAVNFRGDKERLRTSIMNAMPLGFLPLRDSFDDWMEAFAETFPRPPWPRGEREDQRKAGSRIGWIQNRETFSLERPVEE